VVTSCNDGDCTVCTFAVATFRNLNVSVVARSGKNAFTGALGVERLAQVVHQCVIIEFSIIMVDLRNFLIQFIEETFAQTTHNIELLYAAFILGVTKVENHVDALLFRIIDEAASVDHSYTVVKPLGVMIYPEAVLLELEHEPFRIDQILGTPHCYDVYVHVLNK
jgi:hypothetical protein